MSTERIRIVTAAALFDGHDVSISIFAKLMHQRGAEVIHIGHNRSVDEILATAIQEDVDAILISSYQGGHNEFFKYLVDRLRALPGSDILVFGGGGGVILPQEIEDLQKYGVERIYHAVDGQTLGIHGIADDIIEKIKKSRAQHSAERLPFSVEDELQVGNRHNHQRISQQLSHIERHIDNADVLSRLRALYAAHDKKKTVVFGVTGTGGCGKSSLIDELINRFLKVTDDISIGVLAVDPSKKLSGGAFLGDRIRYNNINNDRVFFRSFATRESASELSHAVRDALPVLRAYGFDIIFVETSGIGQGDSQVTDICDHSIFVMTSEFGAPSQLEKIDMLDLADSIVINKFEKIGSEDALRHVSNHYRRSRNLRISRSLPPTSSALPIYAASSNQFNNRGVNRLFKDLLETVKGKKRRDFPTKSNLLDVLLTDHVQEFGLIGSQRVNYLTEIADTVRNYYRVCDEQARLAGQWHALQQSIEQFGPGEQAVDALRQKLTEKWKDLSRETQVLIEGWEERVQGYSRETISNKVQNEEQTISLFTRTLSSLNIPKVALPKYRAWEELVRFFYRENLPGFFPFTAGVFPFKRTTEDPRRQFAGEGTPERTNKRLHYLSTK